jgi:hypothetical protein
MIYLLTNHQLFYAYMKSRENPEPQYWPDQSQPIRENNLYWTTLSRIGRGALSVSQSQF